MAKQGKEGWINDAADVFSAKWQADYAKAKEAYKAYKVLADKCEADALVELHENGLAQNMTAVFRHMWGFSFKVVPAEDRQPKAKAKPQIDLATYLAQADMLGVGR
jgi:hypothetical protein